MQDQIIFALDIGTRSVVGIILEETGQHYRVLDILVKEHKDRAMIDGQIHDIVAVAKVIREIKTELEAVHGPLQKVCVAAAGRALKTEKARASVPIAGKPMLLKDDITFLELAAVQNAQAAVAEKQASEKIYAYYCVGYSVLHYLLDDEVIGNLIDQQGDDAAVEIIATFLPRVVVDSLIKALHRADLELEALTLEPIAAIDVLVPPSMRRLNVALVDVGAGTSDIAITDSGTVIAYGMVPVAGDEVTEALSDHLLLDFPQAEQAKRELWTNDSISVTDILGFQTILPKEKVVNYIAPAINKLAGAISCEIKKLNNGRSPKAVMLVGGGSMTPDLPLRLARELELPDNRVAIRGADAIQGLTFPDNIPGGPENITPIGIAISARKSPIQYVTVTVNERTVRMFEAKQLTVGDCILASGLKVNKMYGKPGMALFVNMNGQQLTIPGSYGGSPVILKNGKFSNLEEPLSNGDQITVQQGKDGQEPRVKIREFLDEVPTQQITVNGSPYYVSSTILINGAVAKLDDIIQDRDSINVRFPETIGEALQSLKLNELLAMLKPFRLQINGKETFIPAFSAQVLLNLRAAKTSDPLPPNAVLSIQRKLIPNIGTLAELREDYLKQTITVTFNNETIVMEKTTAEFIRENNVLEADDPLYNGDIIEINPVETQAFIFQDIFNYVEVEKPENSSGNFSLLKNDEEATFYSPLYDGDRLAIVWPPVVDTSI